MFGAAAMNIGCSVMKPIGAEIARRFDRQVGRDARCALQRRERRRRADIERVAVRRGLRRGAHRDRAAGAGLVDDDGLLAPHLGEAVGHQPRRDVGGAAGRRVDDDADRLVRIGLRSAPAPDESATIAAIECQRTYRSTTSSSWRSSLGCSVIGGRTSSLALDAGGLDHRPPARSISACRCAASAAGFC